jgi:Leucine-rich repeat (LRR) protein
VLCVYLEDVELDASMSMQAEAQQALYVGKYKSDEEFIKELKKASIFDKIELSGQQKKQQKVRTLLAVAAALIILIAAIVIIKPLLRPAGGTNAMEVLELQGLSKEDLASVEEIYIVGNEAMDHDAAARYEDGDTSTIIYEVSDDEETTTSAGSISDLSGMGQLEKLKVLQLSGQQIEDASELGKLKNLQTLILSCNPLTGLEGSEDLKLDVLDI